MKTVIEMALEAKSCVKTDHNGVRLIADGLDIERFAELIRADAIAKEREACAKVCEATPKIRAYGNNRALQDECAAAIRARSNTCPPTP